MEIQYLGKSAFKLKGKTSTVITDPFGVSLPKGVEAACVTLSQEGTDTTWKSAVSGNPLVLTNPGEYEVAGVELRGFGMYRETKQNIVFKYIVDGVSIVHLGMLSYTLTEVEVEEMDSVDILLVPIGENALDAKKAVEMVNMIEPSIVIPMMLGSIDSFLKEMGKETVEKQPKLTVKAGSIPPELQVVVLSS